MLQTRELLINKCYLFHAHVLSSSYFRWKSLGMDHTQVDYRNLNTTPAASTKHILVAFFIDCLSWSSSTILPLLSKIIHHSMSCAVVWTSLFTLDVCLILKWSDPPAVKFLPKIYISPLDLLWYSRMELYYILFCVV